MKKLFFPFFILLSITNIFAQDVKLGAKTFEESQILATAAGVLLEARGYSIEKHFNINTGILRLKLEKGEIDCYFEYFPGTARNFYRKHTDISEEEIKKLDKEKGLVWGQSISYSNGYVIVSKNDKYKLISDLDGAQERIFVNPDFMTRPEGYKKLSKLYNLGDLQVEEFDHRIILKFLKRKSSEKKGDVQLALIYETDPEISDGLTMLEDDKLHFKKYHPTPVCVEKSAHLIPILDVISKAITLKDIHALLRQVVPNKQAMTSIVQDWLKNKGIL